MPKFMVVQPGGARRARPLMPKFMVVQPDYVDRVLVIDTDTPAREGCLSGLDDLRARLSSARFVNPGDRFIFDSRPGDLCSIDYDKWIVRLGRDFADPEEQD